MNQPKEVLDENKLVPKLNIKDGNEQSETEIGNQNVKRNLVDTEENFNKTKVLKAELLHEKSDTVEVCVI